MNEDQNKPKSDLTKFLETLRSSFDPPPKEFGNRMDFRQAKIHYEAVAKFNEQESKNVDPQPG